MSPDVLLDDGTKVTATGDGIVVSNGIFVARCERGYFRLTGGVFAPSDAPALAELFHTVSTIYRVWK